MRFHFRKTHLSDRSFRSNSASTLGEREREREASDRLEFLGRGGIYDGIVSRWKWTSWKSGTLRLARLVVSKNELLWWWVAGFRYIRECRTTGGNFWDERVLELEMGGIHRDDIRVSANISGIFISLLSKDHLGYRWFVGIPQTMESISYFFFNINCEFIGKIPRNVGKFRGDRENFKTFGTLEISWIAENSKLRKFHLRLLACFIYKLKIREYKNISRDSRNFSRYVIWMWRERQEPRTKNKLTIFSSIVYWNDLKSTTIVHFSSATGS